MQHEIYYFKRVIIDLFIFLKKNKKSFKKSIVFIHLQVYNIDTIKKGESRMKGVLIMKEFTNVTEYQLLNLATIEETIKQAHNLIERINARSMQRYELSIIGERDLRKSWTLYVSAYNGENKYKNADGNFVLIGKLINTLAEIHDIADSRIDF